MMVSDSSYLSERIRTCIEGTVDGSISFHDYMQMCLYYPQYGYYSRDQLKIGREGDFYTSSSIGSIMGEMIASFILDHWHTISADHSGVWSIVEWGGGNGRMAVQILDEIQRRSASCYKRLTYRMIESSGFHQELQTKTLLHHHKKVEFLTEEQWFSQRDEGYTIVIANELLDAFPVHQVLFGHDGWQEIRVAWNPESTAFEERMTPLTNTKIQEYLVAESIQAKPGQRLEVNLHASDWIKKTTAHIHTGIVLVIDYGDTAEELFSSHRMNGTLMCYHRHRAHDNPYILSGEQDITSHVNFSACIRAGMESNISRWTLQTQKQFLVDAGILNKLQDIASFDPFSAQARSNRAIRQLLLSDQMSELFKVLALYKNPVRI